MAQKEYVVNNRKLCIFLSVFLTCIFNSAFAADQPQVAVFELYNSAGLSNQEAAQLTKNVREQANRTLWTSGLVLIQEEVIRDLLPSADDMAKCQTSECKILIGTNIHADYIVFGEIVMVEGEPQVKLNAYHCESGADLGRQTVKGKNLENGISEAVKFLLWAVRKHSDSHPFEPGTADAESEIPEGNRSRTAAWVCTGASVAGFAMGTVFYRRALDYNDKYQRTGSSSPQSSGQRAQIISYSGFGLGVFSAGAAIYFFRNDKENDKSAWYENIDILIARENDRNQAAVIFKW